MRANYHWDEDKRQVNLAKHGLDFADAWRVHEAPDKMAIDVVRCGEARRIEVAAIGGGRPVLTLVCVLRDNRVRCISLRRASRIERRMYDEWQTS
jgi:uncharacterized DUF497 family protein